MASSLFGSKKTNNSVLNMVQQFNDFKAQYAGQNPQTIVQQMLQNGQMTNEQFQQLSEMAKQFQSFLR